MSTPSIDKHGEHGVAVECLMAGSKVETQATDVPRTMSRKESLSVYFTIAAAACGLIRYGGSGWEFELLRVVDKTVIVTGSSLMTMSNVVFKELYPAEYTSSVSTRVSNALLVGDIFGMILVGFICDRFGRKIALVGTTVLIIIGATLGTAAHGAHGSPAGLFWFLTFARGLTGVGVGGEYPASSTSASEAANEAALKKRGPIVVMVTNFVLDLGGPLAVSIFLIVLSAAGENHLSTVWRVCFGIGIALPLTVFYFRMRMLSSKLYRKGAIKRHVPYKLVVKRYWKSLIGTCGAWFLYDFVIYPNNIFSGAIISSIIPDGSIKKTAEWQLLLGTLALPGVFMGAYLCNVIGRRNTMMLGFCGYIVFGLIIGCAYDKISTIIPLFVVLYGVLQSFGELGPGDMTILTSAESYATAVRGTCYGFSAAFGKVGAAVGTQVFTPIQNNLGKKWTFIIAAICGLAGILVTYFFVPDMTGVDLADEDRKFMQYLRENGWEGAVGEDDGDRSLADDRSSVVKISEK
ncbi:MFS Git1p-related glycerophosphoinositol permease [Cytidiella melzeri]|nr:MFS Git1p-related glycerophosphoinositol permease [Cytidiella melzeri]